MFNKNKMSEKIDWNDPNLDLDSILWKWYEDIDKKEGFIVENNLDYNEKVKEIIDFDSFDLLVSKVEKEKDIKIKVSIDNWWKIELYSKDWDLIWKIWYDWYILREWDIDPNHLWIEVYNKYQWQWYSKILYKLYYNLSLENEKVIFPDYDLASKNSRINLLLSLWFKMTEQYINWIFLPISDIEKDKILNSIKENYYGRQWYSIKLVLDKDTFD